MNTRPKSALKKPERTGRLILVDEKPQATQFTSGQAKIDEVRHLALL